MNVEDKITRANIQIQRRNSFFAYLSLYLKFHEIPKGEMLQDSMGVDVDGNIYYVKEFVEKLSDEELIGVIIHEINHLVFLTELRQGHRDKIGWNCATDLAINSLLKRNNFTLPKGVLMPDYNDELDIGGGKKIKKCSEKTAEEIYDEFPKIKVIKGYYTIGDGKNIGKELGKVLDEHIKGKGGKGKGKELSAKEKRELEKRWLDRTQEAYVVSKTRGDVPVGIERIIGKLHEEKINWRALLSRYIMNQIPYNYTYARPSKKSVSVGEYIPDIVKEKIDVVICVDISGSIGQEELNDFISEVIGIAKAFQERVDMRFFTHETKINDDYEITNGSIEQIKAIKIHGGGGTSHIQFLTDGYSDLDGINFDEYAFDKLFVISKGGDDSQLKGKVCQTIHLKD